MSTATAGPCDRGVAHAVAARPASAKPTAHPTGTLAATILGSSLAYIDGSVVNVALPAIGGDLGVAGGDVSWLINAYLLPLGSLLLLGGVAGDRWGRKRVFLAGMALFTLASLACALAPSFGLLLAARAAQGLGAAFLMPASLALIGAAFSGEARGRAVGTWAAAGAITSALGPLAGGWLVDVVGWRRDLPRQPADRAGHRLARLALRRREPKPRTPRRSTAAARCSRPRAWRH